MSTPVRVTTEQLDQIAHEADTGIVARDVNHLSTVVRLANGTSLIFESELRPMEKGKCPCGFAGCCDSGRRF